MEPDTTGQAAPVQGADSGQGQAPPAATPAPVAVAPSAGATDTQALQSTLTERTAALEEQRRIQAGLDKRISELGDEKAKLEAEVKRLSDVALGGDGVKVEYEKELGSVRAELAEAAGQVGTLQQQLEEGAQANERLRIMASEFADLAPLLEVGALPEAATTEEFRQKMAVLSEKFVPTTQAQAYMRNQGARPPASPPAGATTSIDTLADELRKATEAGDRDRMHELQEQWYAVSDDLK